MSNEVCAFCLGGSTEIPPFGTIKDAQDLLSPCSTCSLMTHRKCLVDWFNTIPLNKVSAGETAENTDNIQNPEAVAAAGQDDADDENEPNFIDLSLRSSWFTVLGSYRSSTTQTPVNRGRNSPNSGIHDHPSYYEDSENEDGFSLSAPCPQCKSKITFQIQGSKLLALNTLIRNTLVDTVQYSGILLGISGAATGLITMGYVGLARCGVSIIDTLVPVSLISPLFQKTRQSQNVVPSQSLSALVSAERPYNLANQLKFQHIPLLPVMLVRMRYSSLIDCIFQSKPRASLTNWISELLLCNYVSSLGNHTLVRSIFRNAREMLMLSKTNKFALFSVGLLFKNVNWWDPAVMIGATVPARWAYDLLYRFTINRAHFNLNTSIRPREIANTLDPRDLSRLETLDTQLAGLKYCISQRLHNARLGSKRGEVSGILGVIREVARVFRDGTIPRLVRLKLLLFFHKSRACLRHDYSSKVLYKSVIMTAISTFLWPFLAADFGKLLYATFISKMPSLMDVEKDKLVFLSNLLGMAVVAFLKDVLNLLLCYQKAKQLSNLKVITQRRDHPSAASRPVSQEHRFPGAYEN